MRGRSYEGPMFGTIVTGGMVHTGSGNNNSTVIREQYNYGGAPDARPARRPADVGVVTVLSEESRAVVRVFERADAYRSDQLPDGTQTHEATFPAADGVLRVVTLQAARAGNHSAIEAYHRLRRHFAPPVIVLTGIAGAIRTSGDQAVDVGDVVIADQVVNYEPRRETAAGPHHRGQAHLVPTVLQNRLNEFFRVHGARIRHPNGSWIRIHRGPIGSGSAVITDANSENRHWLHAYNEKTVAVDTETAAIADACHEDVGAGTGLRGWLAIRGISDRADANKGHRDHNLASDLAAVVLQRLLPYLRLVDAG